MARSVTLRSIVDRARTHADMRSSAFINDTEILALLNDCIPELYDELVGSYEDYYADSAFITLVSGTNVYDLPDDFYKVIGIDYEVSTGSYITLKPFMNAERNSTLTTNINIPAGRIRIRYVPAPPIYTDLDTDTFDGVAGWDRLVVLLLARDMLNAEESDTQAIRTTYQETLQRVRNMAPPRDSGMAHRVVDVYTPNIQMVYGSFRYHLYGDTIELLNTELLGADTYPPFI